MENFNKEIHNAVLFILDLCICLFFSIQFSIEYKKNISEQFFECLCIFLGRVGSERQNWAYLNCD